ncbi:uncharacterized protein LY79DRAFT_592885 [Colletotrichum navitas]|uniref:Peptidase M20 dimerisation domain-containing protein n=1 Tax=Colletotrichum navitas TaxID=681940 RepID=A0AAD8V238_9PEZI|nr:uncharacterized protein LY79DRAFT_592885 [Colletotrichum navitas]KAK1579353.1 hypothetical protein LY79DRAFT_592885 [Colletotrichum navitas]
MKTSKLASLIFAVAASSARAASYTEALLALHKSLVGVYSTSNAGAPGTEVLKTYLENNFTAELQTIEGNHQNVYAYSYPCCGISDAKGSIAAQVTAVEDLRTSGEMREGGVSLLFVGGEQEAVVFGEPTENELVRAHEGVLGLNVTASGIARHSRYPEQGRNAIDLLVRSLGAIIGVELLSSKDFSSTTLNVGVIKGRIASNVILENANARASIQVAVNTTREYISLSVNTGREPTSLDCNVKGKL